MVNFFGTHKQQQMIMTYLQYIRLESYRWRIRLILWKAAGILNLISQWFKRIKKTASADMKGVPTASSSYINGLLKATANGFESLW
jgi:hypothetical protein